MRRLLTTTLVTTLAAASLAACGGSPSSSGEHKMSAVASFYPIEFALEQVGGDKLTVSDLTKPGVEPHDLDLSPRQVGSVGSADHTFYVKGFQKAVDDAVTATDSSKKAEDLSGAADLSLKLSQTATVGGQSEEGGDKNAADPHFWLDPVRYKKVVEAIAEKLESADPDNKSVYAANAAALTKQLDQLNADYARALASCSNSTIVTGHAAFGYLAQRYGLKQVGVTGVSPDEEATPKRLAAVTDFVTKNHITTVYSETLVSPKTAQTVASETGAQVKVLDPIEGITDASAGKNYLEVMRSNLTTLEQGQGCK